jgi:hypothetical protein
MEVKISVAVVVAGRAWGMEQGAKNRGRRAEERMKVTKNAEPSQSDVFGNNSELETNPATCLFQIFIQPTEKFPLPQNTVLGLKDKMGFFRNQVFLLLKC